MAAVRINLLPHREQKRQARQRQFISLALSLVVLGLAIVALVHGVLSQQIENQKDRNNLLKKEIAKLDEQIKEIDRLRDQIQAVLARKQVVETLQANRSEAVHLLDQLVRQLPDGIYLKNVKQSGAKVTVSGYAQSNARVSTLMRNIEASPWLGTPELVEIKLVQAPGTAKDRNLTINEFTMTFLVKRAAPMEAKLGPGPSGPGGAQKGAPAPKAAPAAPPPKTKAALPDTGALTSAAGPSPQANSDSPSRPPNSAFSGGSELRILASVGGRNP